MRERPLAEASQTAPDILPAGELERRAEQNGEHGADPHPRVCDLSP